MFRTIAFTALLLAIMSCGSPDNGRSRSSSGAQLSALPADFVVADAMIYTSLQTALKNGQLDFAEHLDAELAADSRRMIAGLKSIIAGRTGKALSRFQALLRESGDSGIRVASQSFVANLLYDRGEYAALAAMLGDSDDAGARLVRLLSTLPAMTLRSGGSGLTQLDVGPRGHPSVQVSVNGHKDLWFFDTGASQSVVSKSVARELGVVLLDAPEVNITTSTTIVRQAQLGLLDELVMGDVVARNVPVLVYDDADLSLDLDDGTTIDVRGIVGWPVIRRLRAELNYRDGFYSARLSTPHKYPERNLTWMGYPLVSLASDSGQRLLFGLDTGSWNTSITHNIFSKLDFAQVREDIARVGGIGGAETVQVKVVDRLGLALAGTRIELTDIQSETNSGSQDVVFFTADGVLGSDIARHGRLILDYPNAYLGLEQPGAVLAQ